MFRFFFILGILAKYSFIYLLLKLNLYKKPKEKILRNFFEDAGGSFVKFGQLLSLRIDILPKEYSLELLDLLDNIQSFPYSDVQAIFFQELGTSPEKVFKDFQKEPFASASFGQVHAAKLMDGEIVAVKVMRPGITQDVTTDFFFISLLAFAADLFKKIEALPWKEFAQEFKKWTISELDYRTEAENAEKIYNSAKNVSQVVIPKTFHRLSTQKILVQEYIEGIPLSKALRGLRDGRLSYKTLENMGIDIKKAPRILVAELFREYFLHGVFHADPHPGNILLLENDRIALVDFGMMGEAFKYNKKSFLLWLKSGIDKDYKKGIYHFANFSAGDLKNLISSVLPASVDEKHIDEFILLLSDYFSASVTHILSSNVENLKEKRKDYTTVFLEILKISQSFKVKLPEEAVILLRITSIIGLLGKEIDSEFMLFGEVSKFLKEYSEEELTRNDQEQYLKRINRERAIELFNNWLAYLFEKDPKLYNLVNNYINKYNIAAGN